MSVILRKSKLEKGYSFYFDISYNGKRWTEWLKIRVKQNDSPAEKSEKIQLAKQMRSERDRELIVLGKGLPGEVHLRQRDFFHVYDEMCKPRIKAHHIYQNIRKKVEDFNGNKPLPILSIDKAWLTRFLTFLEGEGLADNTVHQYFSFIGTILREAMCAGYIIQNPHSLFSRHERPKLKRPKADFLTEEELNKFINAETIKVDEQLKQMFLFSCFTGLRWSDCQRVTWQHIRKIKTESEIKQAIVLTQKKTSEQVVVPLTASALALLENRRKEILEKDQRASEFIFPNWSVETEKKYSHPLRTVMAKQMKYWAKDAKFDKERRFRFHLARHTYAAWLIQNGVDLYTVSKLLGHADMSATTIYAHVSDQMKLSAVEKLPFVNALIKTKQKSFGKVA